MNERQRSLLGPNPTRNKLKCYILTQPKKICTNSLLKRASLHSNTLLLEECNALLARYTQCIYTTAHLRTGSKLCV